MEFQLFHTKYFDAIRGTYSIVTEREEYDSQITLTDVESQMVINFFALENLHVGNVGSNKTKASKEFLLYPHYNKINLNLVFPKPNKLELRLYLSSRGGFKPKGGEVWFLYINQFNELVIGSMSENKWNDLDHFDPVDSNYLEEVEETISSESNFIKPPKGKIIEQIIGQRKIYVRNPRIAASSIINANFKCQVNPLHRTFIAQKTKNPFVEAHHFVPMKFQDSFKFPLDCVENVISLCPTCHRGIHLGEVNHKKKLIQKIYLDRKAIEDFELGDMYSFYNCLRP